MLKTLTASFIVASLLAAPAGARASTYDFTFVGGGVRGSIELTYGTETDTRYPNAFVVTGISGTFSDLNIGIVDAPIGPIVPRNFAAPEPSNQLAPDSFSHYTVTTGLRYPPISYDDLFWPAGSPPTATDYPIGGGILDIYGLLFGIGSDRVVNLWSNGGTLNGSDYGAAVVTHATALDYVTAGITVPEPASAFLLGSGLAVAFLRRTKRMAAG